MTNTASVIVLSVLISVIITMTIGYFFYKFYMRNDLNLLRRNINELFNKLDKVPLEDINLFSEGRINKKAMISDNKSENSLQNLSDEELKKKAVHQSIIRKVAEDMIRSLASPWPIQSMSNTIPAMPKITERPLWEDLVHNHMATIDDALGEEFEKYQKLIMEYASVLPVLAREIQRYLILNPSGISKEFESNFKEVPKEILYKSELIYKLINFKLGFTDRPEIKSELKQKKISKAGSLTTLSFDGYPVAIIPQGLWIEFNTRMNNILESHDLQINLHKEIEKAILLKEQIATLKEKCIESLTSLINSDTLYGKCNMM